MLLSTQGAATGSGLAGGTLTIRLGKSEPAGSGTGIFALELADDGYAAPFGGAPWNIVHWKRNNGFVANMTMGGGTNGIGAGVAASQISSYPQLSIASHTQINIAAIDDAAASMTIVYIDSATADGSDEASYDFISQPKHATSGTVADLRISTNPLALGGTTVHRFLDIKKSGTYTFGILDVAGVASLDFGAGSAPSGQIRLQNDQYLKGGFSSGTVAYTLVGVGPTGNTVFGDTTNPAIFMFSGGSIYVWPAADVLMYCGGGERVRFSSTTMLFSIGDVQFASTVASPTIKQADLTTASATGQTTLIQAQNATGVTSTGGALDLRTGTGTTAAGTMTLRTGATTKLTLAPTLTTSVNDLAIGPLAVGVGSFAKTGTIRLPNGAIIKASHTNGTTDITFAQVDTANQVQFGDSVNAVNLVFQSAGGSYFRGTIFNVQDSVGSVNVWALTTLAASATSLTIDAAAVTPTFIHAARASDAATTNMAFMAQAPFATATGTNRNAGGFVFTVPVPVTGGTRGRFTIVNGVGGIDLASFQSFDPNNCGLYISNATTWLTGDSFTTVLGGSNNISIRPTGNIERINVTATTMLLTLPNAKFDASVASPNITHNAATTDVAPTSLTIRAQDSWVSSTHGVNSVGGNLNLSSGLSYINETNTDVALINFQTGGVTGLSYATSYLYWASGQTPMFFQAQAAGTIAGKDTTFQAQSGGATAGVGGNLIFDGGLGTGGSANGTHWFRTGTTNRMNLDENGFRFTQDMGDLSGAVVWDQTQRAGTGANNGYGININAQNGQTQAGATANNRGGHVVIAGGLPGTGGSGAVGRMGNATLQGFRVNLTTTSTTADTGVVAITGALTVGAIYTQAMADAAQTISVANSAANIITTTGANTAVRALTISLPPANGTIKIIRNNCTTNGITVKFLTGAATATIPPATSAVVVADGTNAIIQMSGT
jgi:hypothetical protein